MLTKYLVFGLLGFLLLGCVTESKLDDSKPFLGAASDRDDVKDGSIIVKCRTRYDRQPGKLFICGPTTVKVLDETTKSSKEYSFKGDKIAIPVMRSSSYSFEVKTKGCESPRVISGMTMGIEFSTQFENCGGSTIK